MDNVLTVEQVFTERLLRVPDYQRGYAWENRQLTDFMDDLELLPPDKSHYTGTLILHPRDSQREMDAEGKSYAVVDVVDGQQRLTTIVLLLDAIREEFQELGLETLAAGIRKNYVSVEGLHGQDLTKLTLNRDANEFWKSQILADDPGIEGPRIQSHRRLQAAALYFEQYLTDKREDLGDSYQQWALGLFNKVTHQLKLTLYNVDDAADVGVIFEVMNDRGKPLTELEKVKNFLLYSATKLPSGGEQLTDVINNAWRDILENLMRAGLTDYEDQLLRAHWLMSYEPQARLWNQSKSVKERFSLRSHSTDLDRLRDELLEYTRSLQAASLAFCEIMHPRHNDAFRGLSDPDIREDIRETVEKVRRTRQVASFLPLLLAGRLRLQQSPQDFLKLTQLCELFAFRVYLLMRSPSHSGQTILFRLGHLYYRQQANLEGVLREIQGLCLRLSPQHRFMEQFQLDESRSWYAWAGIKYLLYEYEEHLTGPRQTRISWDQVEQRDKAKTIEHVLPQTPTDSYWTDRFTAEQMELYTHDLGNLCLTYDNSAYLNHPFPAKKGTVGALKKDGVTPQPCYANSILMQEKQLAAYDDWTPEAIAHRREELVRWALNRWHLAEPTGMAPFMTETDEDDETNELGEPAGTGVGNDLRTTLTAEEAAISMVLPTHDNPYVIQPYNQALYQPHHKGYSGQCEHCGRPAAWSVKGAVRWFAMCTSHTSVWTGWEHRAGADLVEVARDEVPGKSREKRRQDKPDWSWDRYLAESNHSRSKIELVRTIANRITEASGWRQAKYKQQIHFLLEEGSERQDRRVAMLQFWNVAPRLVIEDARLENNDPWPHLPGKRPDKHGNSSWDFKSADDVPLDFSPVVRLTSGHHEAKDGS